MKKPLLSVLFFIVICQHVFSQAANNTCATAVDLGIITGNYTATSGDLYNANQTNPAGSPCANRYDVWYKFTLPATSTIATITVIRNSPSGLTNANTYIELFNTTNCTINGTSTGGCNDISIPRKYSGLTLGGTYYFRVNTTVNPNSLPATNWGFTVYVVPFNDDCNNVSSILVPGSTIDGSLLGATASASIPVGCATGNPDDDVWYSFTALYSYATITLSNIGSNLATSGARMQLFSGACLSLSSLACSGSTNIINATGLNPTSTYYIRVYSAGNNPQAGTAWGYSISLTPSAKVQVGSGRMKEIYHQQIISAPNILADPWEVTYGPDDKLWITEAKGYRVYKMDPTTGVRDTVLDISQGSTFFTAPADVAFNVQFSTAQNPWPQGGFAGLALHPKFLDATTPQNYVYVSYVRSYTGGSSGPGHFFVNRVVRFTYNTGTNRLESPVSLCDTLPGSHDHNSQRMIIAPVGATYYLFYGSGDMGAGQGAGTARAMKAQNPASYEGKILRFNLITDGDAGLSAWIPNDNPYNILLGVQSAVWSIGQRNNQGFARDTTKNILYGASHGPYSDDELNIIEGFRNYGHPLVIGYVADGNYNGTVTTGTAIINTSISAGAPHPTNFGNSTCQPVGNESNQRDAINLGVYGQYKDPLFSAYPGATGTGPGSVTNIWQNNPNNGGWPSEGWSGLDFYSNTIVPGWKNSLVAASLKWGRLVRLKLSSTGTTTLPNNTINDTISYFGSQNRFRDLAFAPNGKDIYVIMDRSTTTSGPSALFPVVPSCQGCVQKYTFLGYADVAGKSTIDTSIDVTKGTLDACTSGTTITIDDTNKNLWVPITGPDGNIMAEIHAMNQVLGAVTSSFYQRTSTSTANRVKFGVHYLNRNITISPAVTTFGTPVKVRFYISKAEFDTLDADPLSGITTGIGQLRILKNNDACGAAAVASTQMLTPTNSGVDLVHGDSAYVLQTNISGFSSFYFATASLTLPLELVYFKGALQNNSTLLQWETTNENNSSHFIVERSTDGRNFDGIGTVAASGTTSVATQYALTDNDVKNLGFSVIYYRLKMFDIDGAFKYSSIVTITLPDITGRLSVFPNPATDEVKATMEVVASGKVYWKLSDNSGRVIMQSSVQVKKGSNAIMINLHGIPSGLYYLNVSGAGINQHVKLQKL